MKTLHWLLSILCILIIVINMNSDVFIDIVFDTRKTRTKSGNLLGKQISIHNLFTYLENASIFKHCYSVKRHSVTFEKCLLV